MTREQQQNARVEKAQQIARAIRMAADPQQREVFWGKAEELGLTPLVRVALRISGGVK